MQIIDARNYVVAPRMNSTNAIVLAHRLVETAEADAAEERRVLDPTQLRLLGQVTRKVEGVKVVMRDRVLQKPEKLRPVVQPVTNVLIAMHGGLEAIARLPIDAGTRSKRAQRVLAIAFPEGTAFASGDAEAVWVAARHFLAIVDDQGLATEIGELIGPEFLELARHSVDALGTVLGVEKGARRLPGRSALSEALEKLGEAITRYSRQLVAELDEEDPASVERFLRLVAPLDAHRASYAGGGNAGDEDLDGEVDPLTPVSPTEPVPPPMPDTPRNGDGPFVDEDEQ